MSYRKLSEMTLDTTPTAGGRPNAEPTAARSFPNVELENKGNLPLRSEEILLDELHSILSVQAGRTEHIHGKAARAIELNVIFVGLLLTSLALIVDSGNDVPLRNLLNTAFYFGVLSTVLSLVAAYAALSPGSAYGIPVTRVQDTFDVGLLPKELVAEIIESHYNSVGDNWIKNKIWNRYVSLSYSFALLQLFFYGTAVLWAVFAPIPPFETLSLYILFVGVGGATLVYGQLKQTVDGYLRERLEGKVP